MIRLSDRILVMAEKRIVHGAPDRGDYGTLSEEIPHAIA